MPHPTPPDLGIFFLLLGTGSDVSPGSASVDVLFYRFFFQSMQNAKNAKKGFWALTRKNPEPRFWGIFWSLWEHFGSLRLTFGVSFGRRGAPMAPGTDRPGGNLDRKCGPNLWTEIAGRHSIGPESGRNLARNCTPKIFAETNR